MIKKKLNPKCGKRLSECRAEKNITQEQLAEKTGYSIQHISYIECGKRNLSLDAANAFSKILDVRTEYLLCEDDCKTIDEFASSLFNKGPISELLAILGLEVTKYEYEPMEDKKMTPEDKAAFDEEMRKIQAIVDEVREFASFKIQRLNKEHKNKE